jgi:hypothetical protein
MFRNDIETDAELPKGRVTSPQSDNCTTYVSPLTFISYAQIRELKHHISNMNSPDDGIPVKPMRPLTAYHIFLQIEREYIIQTSEGEIADKSSLDNKVYLDDVATKIFVSSRLVCRSWQA